MKTPAFKNLLAVAALALAPFTFAGAQTTVTTTTADAAEPAVAVSPTRTTTAVTTTNTAGTIQEFTPGSSRIIVKTATGAPTTYTYSKKTTFVDASGNVINYETIKAGEPTTVYYTMEAGQPVVSKVVVNRTVAPAAVTKTQTTETTTTTTKD